MCVYKCWIFELIYSHPFNPLLSSSQGRNPTWGRPARRSRPLRSRPLSCSSRPSGRWRTSSMSLHWSSSSLSELMLSEKRMENSTCWHKISSTRRFTPKTSKTHVHRRVWSVSVKVTLYRLIRPVWDEEEKQSVSNRLLQTVWPVCTRDWEHNVELQSDPPLTQRSGWWQFCYSHPCLPAGRSTRVSSSAASNRLCSQQLPGLHPLSLSCQRSSMQRASAGTWPETDRANSWLALPSPDTDKTFSLAMYCLVVFSCILTLYYRCLLYVKTFSWWNDIHTPHHYY